MTNEFNDAKRQTELITSGAEVGTSFFGTLAGLTFAAAVLIFSFRTSLPFWEMFITTTLVTTILFVMSATACWNAAGYARGRGGGNGKRADRVLEVGDRFGLIGFVLILTELAFMGMYAGVGVWRNSRCS